MTYRDAGRDPSADGSFVGSFRDDPGQAVIVLRGDIDAVVVDRLAIHLDAVLAAAIRFVRIDARAVDSYHETLLDLLGHTQHRLGRRKGLLQVSGLHPTLLTDPVQPAAAPDPAAS